MKPKNKVYHETKAKKENKYLVKILQAKIFKGFRQIKAAQTFGNDKRRFVHVNEWDQRKYEPFEDNYNLQYKNNVLQKLQSHHIVLSIKNQSKRKEKYGHNQIETYPSIASSNKQLENKIFLTNPSEKIHAKEQEEKMKWLYKQIFNDKDEWDKYSNVPFCSIESYASKKNNKNNPPNPYDEYEGLSNTQFLFKWCHPSKGKNKKILNFNSNSGVVKGFVSKRGYSAKPWIWDSATNKNNILRVNRKSSIDSGNSETTIQNVKTLMNNKTESSLRMNTNTYYNNTTYTNRYSDNGKINLKTNLQSKCKYIWVDQD